ncbi:basic amino acid/polyamine antiporter [Tenacibaculum sp. SG-28]|uniref:basic amino acid/polyamine antiporter n=1 Tax=Tenacibaculum sp. SG-28 TaxID=754426 RepID=UPI000CF39471|nr:basic amino acid/polyamine antiporter [Tenacibaculum sp. SG-28]PQJ23474.1 arginine:ornithine antiporter [Tenacibaculum sp. SG-28]
MAENNNKVGLFGLIAIVFTSMVGSGVYNIPQNMAAGAALGPVIISWVITGIGMYFLALTFGILSQERSDLSSGIYGYAKEGFGNYMGFNAAWGYWISGAVGNLAFIIMLNDAFGYFFPSLLDHGITTIFFSLVIIWVFSLIVMRSVTLAAKLNSITTIIIFIALILITILIFIYFQLDTFTVSFWGEKYNLDSVGSQIKGTMLVTLWCFIGIEGAVVISSRAKSTKDIGKATKIGLILALILYALISILAYGLLQQPELAKLKNPSAVFMLSGYTGEWVVQFVSVSVIISLLSSLLAWTILVAEVPYAAAKEGVFPKAFAKENKQKSPYSSLIITAVLMSVLLLLIYISEDVYMAMVNICSIMIIPPYIFSAAFLWKSSEKSEIYADNIKKKIGALYIGILATLYGFWLLYSAGLSYLLLACIFYAIGIPFYYSAHKNELNEGKFIFTKYERVLAILFVFLAVVAIDFLLVGKIIP